jgi:hypothetical protein
LSVQELPSGSWEQFLADRDGAALLAVLASLPLCKPPRDVDYPEIHRICDLELGGRAYRLSRLVDLADGQERLLIEPTEFADFREGGVPYELQGAALRRWVTDETLSSAKGPVAWEEYLGG